MPKLSVEEKRARIRELEKTIEDATEEIHTLLAPPEPANPLPRSFSLNEKVLGIVREAGAEGIAKGDVVDQVKRKYGVSVTSSQVQSTLAYLKNSKKYVEIIGRGRYRLHELYDPEEENDGEHFHQQEEEVERGK